MIAMVFEYNCFIMKQHLELVLSFTDSHFVFFKEENACLVYKKKEGKQNERKIERKSGV